MKYARNVDDNQTIIVGAFRVAGATVQHVHTIGGALDLIIGFAGIDCRVEIKNPDQKLSKQKLTPAEQDTFDTWKGRPPVIIKTPEEAQHLVWKLREEAYLNKKCST